MNTVLQTTQSEWEQMLSQLDQAKQAMLQQYTELRTLADDIASLQRVAPIDPVALQKLKRLREFTQNEYPILRARLTAQIDEATRIFRGVDEQLQWDMPALSGGNVLMHFLRKAAQRSSGAERAGQLA